MKLLAILFVVSLFFPVFSKTFISKGIDEGKPTSFYICLRQSGYDQIGILGFPYPNEWFNKLFQDVVNAKSAELTIELVLMLCRGLSPKQQVKLILDGFGKKILNRVWLYPYWMEGIQTEKCMWRELPPQENCLYIQNTLRQFRNNQINAQFFSDGDLWAKRFGQRDSCRNAAEISPELWWIAREGQSGPDFSDYRQIGGWKKPYIKMLDDSTGACGQSFFTNYFE